MPRFFLKITAMAVGFILLTLLGLYLSGFIFLLLSKNNPLQAELKTMLVYGSMLKAYPFYQKKLTLAIFLGFGMGYGLPVILYFKSKHKIRALYGDARFATSREMAKMGLLSGKGILVGKWNERYLQLDGQQFVLLAAPTRSGKGVGVVIPNLLSYQDSVVVLDIKLENYQKTAGFRQHHGQRVFLFSPFASNLRTHRYNPLGYVREGAFRVGDLQEIAAILYPDTRKDDDFFPKQSRNFFVGLALYLLETPELPCTFGELLRQSSGCGRLVKDHLAHLIQTRHSSQRPLSPACVDALNRVIHLNDTTQSSVIGSFQAPLSLWMNPILDAATSHNDFDLRALRREPMSIYVGINPREVPKASILITLFFAQLVNLNMEKLPEEDACLKYTCLLIMDEFTAMGKIPVFADANAFIAGYNLRLLTIIQSPAQLASKYGQQDAKTFRTNHAMQILYAPKEQDDAKEYSEMLGYETVKGRSISRQLGLNQGRQSESESDQRRALMLPQELRALPQNQSILVMENSRPILCEKIKYYEEAAFKKRLMPAPPIPLLNMDTHEARLEKRIRPMEPKDLEGLHADQIVCDTEKLDALDPQDSSPENVQRYVMESIQAITMGQVLFQNTSL